MIEGRAEAPKKECLQSDLDELVSAIYCLEKVVGNFTFPSSIRKSVTDVAQKPPTEPTVDILRRMVQMSGTRVQEITEVLEKELSKLS